MFPLWEKQFVSSEHLIQIKDAPLVPQTISNPFIQVDMPYNFCLSVPSLIHCPVSYVSGDTHFCIHTASAVLGIQLVLKYW